MIVISPTELSKNLKKYLDLADKERILIQRGKNETFELLKREHVSEDPYFDDPNNIKAIEQGISDIKEGKYKTLDPEKPLWENIL
ncbi:hypothetical protein [Pedobacter sp.]|uniref:hypothetical protein n=1 Tax=Pedobacter sp. TaxID=1411316 RepID=UPI003D7FE277